MPAVRVVFIPRVRDGENRVQQQEEPHGGGEQPLCQLKPGGDLRVRVRILPLDNDSIHYHGCEDGQEEFL